MRLLLDTHTLFWIVRDPKKVSAQVTSIMKSETSEVFVSAATAWEIATKVRKGKLAFDPAFLDTFDDHLRGHGFEPLTITSAHASAGGRLNGAHGDPFDRMLAAQAMIEGLTVATVDAAIAALGAKVVW